MRRSSPAASDARDGPVVLPIQAQRFLDAPSLAEKIRKRIGQAKVGGELRAIVGTAENPQFRMRGACRMRADRAKRMALHQRRSRYPCLQVAHLLRKFVGGIRVTIERKRRQPIRARRTSDAKIDAPGAMASSTRNCSATLSAE